MSRFFPRLGVLSWTLLLAAPLLAQQTTPVISKPLTVKADDAIERIKDEGLNHSQVMETLSYLTDVIGPRLTASPNLRRANDWTKEKLTGWGLQNAHLESWGPFGRGWSLERFSMQVVSPQTFPVIAYPKAWSTGFKGTKMGDIVLFDAKNEADLATYKGKLKNAIVLNGTTRAVRAHFDTQGTRWTDKQLADMEAAQPRAAGAGGRRPGAAGRRFEMTPEMRANLAFQSKRMQFLIDEGAAVMVDPSFRGDGGTLFVQSATVPLNPDAALDKRVSPWDKDAPKTVPQVVMSAEHYNRLVRLVKAGEKPKMAVELAVQFHDKDLMAYNTVAEIPGTDLKDEIVMLGGHMDSWHGGTGATDNGAGVSVCMEAVRIIKALGLKPRRTIRIALWSGEEQGLFGSRNYVAQHFGAFAPRSAGAAETDPPVLNRLPEYEKLAGYFNLDNGTGKVRGVYLQGNEAVRPIFQEWLVPFKDMGAATLTINTTGGTDHLSFDSIGLPGFQFIQDEIEYDTRTHHSNQDVFDRIQAEDMKQASVIMAAFVYNTAMRDEKLPRKPLR